MFKKVLKSNLGLILSTPSLLLVSCGPNETSINFNEMNNLVAYENVFTYQDEETEVNFSLLPQIKEIVPPIIDDENTDTTFIMQDNNFLKLNCDKYVCNSTEFQGKALTYDTYNNIYIDHLETSKVQFSYDNLAKTFNLDIFNNITENEAIFYDFSNNSININYNNSLYYFDQYKLGEDLILVSNQDIEFIGENASLNKIDFYDQNYVLTLERLIELTNNQSLSIEENSIKGTISSENEKNLFSQLFWHFDNSLKFTLKVSEEDDLQIWTANFNESFILNGKQISNIKLNLEIVEQEV